MPYEWKNFVVLLNQLRIKQKPGIAWLCAACIGGCVDMVVSLIQAGADVNGAKGPQPLFEAKSYTVLKMLIENGARLKRECECYRQG